MATAGADVPTTSDFRNPPRGVSLDQILKLSFSRAPWAIHATAVELEIFECLLNKPLESEAIAETLHCNPIMMHRFLDALVSLGWLEKIGVRFDLAPTPRFFAGNWGVRKIPIQSNPFWSRLLSMLRGGRVEQRSGGGQNWADFGVQRHMALRALAGEFHETFALLDRARVFRQARTLLDVAAGHGLFAIGMKKNVPALDVTMLELPSVLPITERFVESYGLEGNASLVAGDVHTDMLPGTFDIIFVSNLSPLRSSFEYLCRKAYGALNDGGVFVYKDIVPRRDWGEAFYPLAHKLTITVSWGDPRACSTWPPTAEEACTAMNMSGFSRTDFLGWIGRWCTVAVGWK